MSVCVTIRTKKRPTPDEVFDGLFKNGEKIIITSKDYPCAKVGNLNKALRGIELNEVDDGVEVRVCTFGSADDYRLFAKTVKLVMDLTGGKAYYDDDDDSEIIDPLKEFDEKWVQEQRKSCFNMLKVLACQHGQQIVLYGLFTNICIGPNLFMDFGVFASTKTTKKDIDKIQDYLVSVQWRLSNKNDTSTQLVMPDPKNPEATAKTISMISIKDGKVTDFDYISYADLFGIIDMDNKELAPVLIPFERIKKIVPEGVFRLVDECQMERMETITPEMVRQMMNKACIFQPDDLFHEPVNPGEGFDETQNTVILMWNPSISSITMDDHNYAIDEMFTEQFNWSIWEHDKTKCGDRFFMVCCGEGRTGIVMSGVFVSHPYEAEDWSGKGRKVFYMDMEPNVMLNPEEAPMITTAELEETIPTFKWNGGHSGRILPKEDAKKLETMWEKFIDDNQKSFDGYNMNKKGLFSKI